MPAGEGRFGSFRRADPTAAAAAVGSDERIGTNTFRKLNDMVGLVAGTPETVAWPFVGEAAAGVDTLDGTAAAVNNTARFFYMHSVVRLKNGN